MPKFIALSGKKQVGKDSCTTMLVQMLETAGKRVKVTAFAEPLKQLCIELLGLDRKLVYGTNEDKDTLCHIRWEKFSSKICWKYGTETLPREGLMTIREVLQIMGTDVLRTIKDDIWAQAPFNKDWSGYDVVILTDTRFPNEKEAVEKNNGIVVRLERETGLNDQHPSETALDNTSFEIGYKNDGTLEELRQFAKTILRNYNFIYP